MSQTPHPDLNAARPWLAEAEVGPALAAELIETQFPQLAPVRLEPLGIGWDNTVYTVNQDYAFRFPRRSMALALMDTEWKLLDTLAPLLALAIPRPLFKGAPSPAYRWPFAGYSLVPGQPADLVDLALPRRAAAIPALAKFLVTLHQFGLDFAQSLDLPGDSLAKVDIVQRMPQTISRLHEAHEKGLLPDISPFERLVEALPASTPTDRPLCLVHGDLYIKHLVVDGDCRLSGVIDWGDAHLGDRATDLSIVYALLPPELHADFWRAYGEVDALTRELARFRALFHNLALILYGEDIGDPHLQRESRRSLAFIAAAVEQGL